MNKKFDVVVYGRVQGVGFRFSARSQAQALGLTGWVQNMRDGSVYATVEGEESVCQAFIDWCRKGPEHARVDKIEISESQPVGMSVFSVRH